MHSLLALLTAAALAGPIPSGHAALTRNPLYKTGPLPDVTCEQPIYTTTTYESVKSYTQILADCFDQLWSTKVRKAGIAYQKPKLVVQQGKDIKGCGTRYRPGDTDSLYCIKTKTIYLFSHEVVEGRELENGEILLNLAQMYGFHVQNHLGILAQEAREWRKLSKKARLELSDRLYLQNFCLAGAGAGAAWESLESLYNTPLTTMMGFYTMTGGDMPGYGTAKSRRHWMTRGYEAASPGVCNTFTAPKSRVG
ncbi:neutral zinc metallopeptidase [Thermoactinospora rubra]|uniref:neutral zinc metallopeptidase n=1 Tax=Thermoactinospora rubra TaxID=1088767 RepID=UPI000A0FA956|nr:neutral zinc metallopeptidase [Thermoactinospora rubra]